MKAECVSCESNVYTKCFEYYLGEVQNSKGNVPRNYHELHLLSLFN
jgi:hypothetical protein